MENRFLPDVRFFLFCAISPHRQQFLFLHRKGAKSAKDYVSLREKVSRSFTRKRL